jgi:hypothetical protein
MKCIVVLDKNDKIVAAKRFDNPKFESYEIAIPQIVPVIKPDQTVVELDMPREYVSLPTEDFIDRLQIASEKKLKLMKTKQ